MPNAIFVCSHALATKVVFGGQLIVCAAVERPPSGITKRVQVFHGVHAAHAERITVMELER